MIEEIVDIRMKDPEEEIRNPKSATASPNDDFRAEEESSEESSEE